MTINTHRSNVFHQLGRIAGRTWRWLASQETSAKNKLVLNGLSVSAAKVVLWVANLAVLGVLLYMAFWLATVLLVFIFVGWTARNADCDYKVEPEWRQGQAGYGLYTRDEYRIDPHDPEDEH